MRAHALPLQILLVLALILNGIGGAMASALVALPAHAQEAVLVGAQVAPAQHGDCSDQGHGVAAMDHQEPASDCPSCGDSDCSDSPQCRQACMHASVAVPSLLTVGVIEPRVDAVLHRLDAGHPAPMLPSAIRPPIA